MNAAGEPRPLLLVGPPLAREEPRAALVGGKARRPRDHVQVQVRQRLGERGHVDLLARRLGPKSRRHLGQERAQRALLVGTQGVHLLDVPDGRDHEPAGDGRGLGARMDHERPPAQHGRASRRGPVPDDRALGAGTGRAARLPHDSTRAKLRRERLP